MTTPENAASAVIDSQQATAALADINDVVRRVRQSRIYQLSSLIMIAWGVLTFAGYLVTYLSPRHAGYAWIAVYVAGAAASVAISAFQYRQSGTRTFDARALLAFLLFMAFGFFTCWLGHFTPRQMGTFWPIYFMLVYGIVGLWVGHAFIAIGVAVTALTLIGYFLIGDAFDLWMAFVNGGGLVVGGLWMRRD
jgi:FtsH-binding integral membrane protein